MSYELANRKESLGQSTTIDKGYGDLIEAAKCYRAAEAFFRIHQGLMIVRIDR
ncbi:MAG: hypothetical protein ACLPX8_13725 [Bryobacteraceae bacterium]|jgi:hypothetical protein